MTPTERAALQARLEAMRDEALGRGPARIQPNRTDVASAGVADEDAQALSEMHQVLASRRNQGQAELLARIAAALTRLAQEPDLAGLCEECEEPIPPARLDAVPWATLCAECQRRHDRPRGTTRRSLTDLS